MYEQDFRIVEKQKQTTNGWYFGLCPFHNDKSPSFGFNPLTGGWICFSGCGKGNIYQFRKKATEAGYRLPETSIITRTKKKKQKVVAKFNYVDEKGNLLYRKERIEPGKKGNRKEFVFKNNLSGEWKYGRGCRPVLYNLNNVVKSKTIYFTEGEAKADLINAWGLVATSLDSGASSKITDKHINYLVNKEIIIVPDNDIVGLDYANAIAETLLNKAKSIKIVKLDGLSDKLDILDWQLKPGNNKDRFLELVAETQEFKHDIKIKILENLNEIDKPENSDKYVKCDLIISGETSEAYHAVKNFTVQFCKRRENGECALCTGILTINKDAQEFIGSCMATNQQVIGMLRDYCCKYNQKPTIKIEDKITIKEMFVHQVPCQYTDELIERKVYYLSSTIIKPGKYTCTGYVKTNPKNQRITLLIDNLEYQEEDYVNYKIDEELLNQFAEFSIQDILHELSESVTKIYQRDEILLAILLTYFSPLQFVFNNSLIRGWLLTCIIGDSGLGKTQTYKKLSEYTGIGDFFSCLTGSRTGLTYALVEHINKGWQVKIGKYPANTRKILAIDEVQYLSSNGKNSNNIDDLQTLSKAMDEGFLQIERVKSKGYESKTRLVMLCNPQQDKIMDNYMYGCETIKSIFKPTLIRRLDLCIFANASDIDDNSFLNKIDTSIESPITPEILKNAIYFIWKLTPDKIKFKATEKCLTEAKELAKLYGNAIDVPLVPIADFRNKLARISTAIACLDMSRDKKNNIVVLTKHINIAVKLIKMIYSNDNCQLDSYSELQRQQNSIDDYNLIEKEFLLRKKYEKINHNFTKAINVIITTNTIRLNDLATLINCSRDTAKRILAILRQFNLIKSSQKGGYYKLPKFIKFLRKFLKKNPNFFKESD